MAKYKVTIFENYEENVLLGNIDAQELKALLKMVVDKNNMSLTIEKDCSKEGNGNNERD